MERNLNGTAACKKEEGAGEGRKRVLPPEPVEEWCLLAHLLTRTATRPICVSTPVLPLVSTLWR